MFLTTLDGFKLVADFAEGVDKCWIMGVWFDFVPQRSYESVHTAVAGKAVIAPYGI